MLTFLLVSRQTNKGSVGLHGDHLTLSDAVHWWQTFQSSRLWSLAITVRHGHNGVADGYQYKNLKDKKGSIFMLRLLLIFFFKNQQLWWKNPKTLRGLKFLYNLQKDFIILFEVLKSRRKSRKKSDILLLYTAQKNKGKITIINPHLNE